MSDFPSISDLQGGAGAAGAQVKGKDKDERDAAPSQLKQKMKDIGVKEKEVATQKQGAQIGLPYIDLATFPVPAEALRVIPEKEARAKKIVCFFFTPDEIRLGVVEPFKELADLAYQIGERHHAKVGVYLISEHSWERVLKLYLNLPIVKPISKEIEITDAELERYGSEIENLDAVHEAFKKVSITDIVTLMVASALKLNSSDIHVEAEEKSIAVRYRIDGVLHDVATLPNEQWKKFISRIKLLAALKINVSNKPQDGRVTLRLSKSSLDVRVSTIPTAFGESVVMRILYSGAEQVSFEDLGIAGRAFELLKREMSRPNGMIITTGPTGSGKTTTMYAILRTLNKPGVKIITMEDPIEIKVKGVSQSQVDPGKGYTFAKGLRSILRQDPDICMVGEIRDLETAEIAVQAALTGHLMLSTIHTGSAAGAIPRFLAMGVKPFLLAPALNSIIGQRLVRRLCKFCQAPATLEPSQLDRVKKELSALPEAERGSYNSAKLEFFVGQGCGECSGLGYKGRVGIYEIFTTNKELEDIILSGKVSEYSIAELAVKNGMITMVQDGLLKALNKVTSVEEVFRVAQ